MGDVLQMGARIGLKLLKTEVIDSLPVSLHIRITDVSLWIRASKTITFATCKKSIDALHT
jgi:hypothetical protein